MAGISFLGVSSCVVYESVQPSPKEIQEKMEYDVRRSLKVALENFGPYTVSSSDDDWDSFRLNAEFAFDVIGNKEKERRPLFHTQLVHEEVQDELNHAIILAERMKKIMSYPEDVGDERVKELAKKLLEELENKTIPRLQRFLESPILR